jgi:hypothetical protein
MAQIFLRLHLARSQYHLHYLVRADGCESETEKIEDNLKTYKYYHPTNDGSICPDKARKEISILLNKKLPGFAWELGFF